MGRRANKPVAEAKAKEVVNELLLREPADIDIELISAHYNLFTTEDGMQGSEARLVRFNDKGLITVNSGTVEEGRKRFSVAHELGHFLLHPTTVQSALCEEEDMNSWRNLIRPEETEANTFAAELLMPKTMITERVSGTEPGFCLISDLAKEFGTSLTASAIQFVKYTYEPCALIASKDLKRIWYFANATFSASFRLADGENIHSYTLAKELQQNDEKNLRADDISAGTWLSNYAADGKECVTEDSFFLRSYGLTLSLIWIHDDIL